MSLTFESFARSNRKRSESPRGFNHHVGDWSTSDWFVAFMGEVGEAANIVKKLNRVRDSINGNKERTDELRRKLKRELGDAYLYLDLLCQSLGLSVAECAVDTFNAKSREIGYPGRPLSAPNARRLSPRRYRGSKTSRTRRPEKPSPAQRRRAAR